MAGEPVKGYEELYATLLEMKVLFNKPPSWYERALARAILGVRQVGERRWLVPGLPGDYYPFYRVWLSVDGRYRCDCYLRSFGRFREKAICTHIAGVMVSRRWRRLKRDFME